MSVRDITKAKEEGPKDALRDLLTSFFTIKWQFYYELVPFAKKSSAALVCWERWEEKDPTIICMFYGLLAWLRFPQITNLYPDLMALSKLGINA